jgi:hypothetical protein
MQIESPRSLRRAYLDWVDQQLEDYKESIPRADLLRLADEAIEEMRVSSQGQYQLTELLLCDVIDRKIIRLLKLPGYRAWCTARNAAEALQRLPADELPDTQVRVA